MNSNETGKRIRAHRKLMGMTQEDLANAAGTSPSFIGHIERGTRNASRETLADIARVLGLSMSVLTGPSAMGEETEAGENDDMLQETPAGFTWVEEKRKGNPHTMLLREIITLLEEVD